ncbi:MAG: IS4 family transposase [bacterium]|nr:IS4 family transposase [bacterium]
MTRTRTVNPNTIASSLRRVKNLPQIIEHQHVLDACQAAGHRWRDGVLNPFATISLFLMQILHGNTACEHVRHFSSLRFTASAYCQARCRLPLAVFQHLLHAVTDAMFDVTRPMARWRGHRTFLLDGSNCSMPDTSELAERFGYPSGQKPGCGFPCAHLMILCDLATGLIRHMTAGPLFTHDMALGVKMHSFMRAGDLVIADRGFAGWAFFALYLQHELHAVIRMHQRLIMTFNPRKTRHPHDVWERLYLLGNDDQVIEWFKPAQRPKWLSQRLYDEFPPSLLVRAIRYRVNRRGFRTRQITLLTTLADHERYPKEEIVRLYGRRWEIETNIRSLKVTMGMDRLHCKKLDGIEKELIMYAIAYNLVRMEQVRAARVQHAEPSRMSFVDALRSVHSRIDGSGPAMRRNNGVPVKLVVNPLRPGRIEPRAVKRRPKNHRLLTLPRAEARQRLLPQQLAA